MYREAMLFLLIYPSILSSFLGAMCHVMVLISSYLRMHNVVFAWMERRGRWIHSQGNMRKHGRSKDPYTSATDIDTLRPLLWALKTVRKAPGHFQRHSSRVTRTNKEVCNTVFLATADNERLTGVGTEMFLNLMEILL